MKVRILKRNFKRKNKDGEIINFREVGEIVDPVAKNLVDRGWAEKVETKKKKTVKKMTTDKDGGDSDAN